jgi:glycosyltransferase involved in cell wall biosynthesis
VVPFYNEAGAAEELYRRVTAVMDGIGKPYEMVFVDDGSKDETAQVLARLAEADGRVTFVELRRNFGQTPALAAGFDHARGEIVIAMDGDLQHAPEDIPALLKPLEEDGYDLVSGWRKRRVDNFLIRRLPSLIANRMMSRLSGVRIHDFGTTFIFGYMANCTDLFRRWPRRWGRGCARCRFRTSCGPGGSRITASGGRCAWRWIC